MHLQSPALGSLSLYLFEWFISAKCWNSIGLKIEREYSVSNSTRCRFGQYGRFFSPFFQLGIAAPSLIPLMLSENIFLLFIQIEMSIVLWCSECPLPIAHESTYWCECVCECVCIGILVIGTVGRRMLCICIFHTKCTHKFKICGTDYWLSWTTEYVLLAARNKKPINANTETALCHGSV